VNVIIPLPWTKPPLTGNRTRGNPYAQAAKVKTALGEAMWAIKLARPTPIAGAEVTLHFRPANRQCRDADGMSPTLKVCLDALTRVQIGGRTVLPDDSWVEVPASGCRIHTPTGEPAAMWLVLDHVTPYTKDPA
jgi:hypothetical protein